MITDELKNVRICILGAGREGQAAYAWLQKNLPDTRLTLLAESPADPDFAARLRAKDRLIIEPITERRLLEFDVLIRSPGISPHRQPMKAALSAGVKVTTPSTLWFSAYPDARTICVTGTKGKSTTSSLIAHMLTACGEKVQLAGNIGLPLLACKPDAVDWWVIELSSYQIADLQAEPDISLILNFSAEHLDWHGDENTYRRDKLHLAELTRNGRIIANALDGSLREHLQAFGNVTWFGMPEQLHVSGQQILDHSSVLPVSMPAGLIGAHNYLNVTAALAAVRAAGVDVNQAARTVSGFEPLPHRLQDLGVRAEVNYVNDSIATTPIATLAALEALKGRRLILIVGGFDRGLDWSRHMERFSQWLPHAVIGIPGNGPQITSCLRAAGLAPPAGIHDAGDLQAAVELAETMTKPGDTVLLSPGAPSFPHFTDFRERGEVFARLCGLRK